MKKNILILLIFFLSLLKIGHLFYKWVKNDPKNNIRKEIISNSMFIFNKHNLLDGSWIHEEDSLATIEIKFKKWVFLYDNEFDKNDIYQYQITDALPKYVNTKLKKGKFIILTTEIDTLEYEILTYNDSIMSLLSFPKENIHVYRKKE